MLYTVDRDTYRNSGKLDLSSHAYLASIRASQDSSLKLFSSQTADTDQGAAKKNGLECHTPTSSRSQYLLEKSRRFSAVKPAEPFFFNTGHHA
jgi:hypothetical protein